jgi:hypothetical protein
MSLTERYIFAVMKRLPQSQRADIEKELRSLIEDMIDERGGYSPEIEENVLKELGDPKILANNYSGRGKCLISPEIYDTYITVVKIAVPVIVGLSVLGTCIDAITSNQNIFESLLRILGGAFSAMLSVFGTVTLVFAVIERYAKTAFLKEMKEGETKGKEWDPRDLPEIENAVKPFNRAGTIIGIIFILVVMFFLNTSNFGIIYSQGQSTNIYYVLDKDVFSSYLVYINILLILQLLFQTSKLIFRKWTYALAAVNTVLNILGLLLFFLIINNANLLRSEFMQSVSTIDTGIEGGIPSILSTIKKVLTAVLPILVLFDCGEGFYYAYKNRNLY